MVKKIEPWFGFTEDKVFGMVMENKEFCKYLLEIIIPDLKIKKIDWLDKQVEINNSERKNEAKEVRLDVLVTDHEGRVFNIEMQTTDQDDIGRRMRYYLSRLDLRYTLNKGKTYRNLKDAYIIFSVILSLRKMINFMSLIILIPIKIGQNNCRKV